MNIRHAIIDGAHLIELINYTLDEHGLLSEFHPNGLLEPLIDELIVNETQPGITLQIELQEHMEYDQLDALLSNLIDYLLSQTLDIRTNLTDQEKITAAEMTNYSDIIFHITENPQPFDLGVSADDRCSTTNYSTA